MAPRTLNLGLRYPNGAQVLAYDELKQIAAMTTISNPTWIGKVWARKVVPHQGSPSSVNYQLESSRPLDLSEWFKMSKELQDGRDQKKRLAS